MRGEKDPTSMKDFTQLNLVYAIWYWWGTKMIIYSLIFVMVHIAK